MQVENCLIRLSSESGGFNKTRKVLISERLLNSQWENRKYETKKAKPSHTDIKYFHTVIRHSSHKCRWLDDKLNLVDTHSLFHFHSFSSYFHRVFPFHFSCHRFWLRILNSHTAHCSYMSCERLMYTVRFYFIYFFSLKFLIRDR